VNAPINCEQERSVSSVVEHSPAERVVAGSNPARSFLILGEKNLEVRGIDPLASRMRSERSTI
jgi:hypothetical protein